MTASLSPADYSAPFVERAQAAIEQGSELHLRAGDAEATVDRETAALVLAVLRARLTGHAVLVEPLPDELTTGQAADVLGVTRPTVVAMVERGALSARLIGTHRRVPTDEVLRLRATGPSARQQKLDELTRLSVEAGLYD